MGKSSHDIAKKIELGDEATYIALFREFYVSLCAYSRRYVGRKDVAEEIVSETFYKIWENRKTIEIKTSVKAYLFHAVCNNSLYYLRQIKKEEKLENYFSDIYSENIGFASTVEIIPEQSLLFEEMAQRIEEAVSRLPAQQQQTFRLKRFEGKKNRKIAEIMGLSVKTVEMHLSKALFSLRENLKGSLPSFLFFILLK